MPWLEHGINSGCDTTEYEAGYRLTEYRKHNKDSVCLAYENISAAGPSAGTSLEKDRLSTTHGLVRFRLGFGEPGGRRDRS
jgi:Xaa-Pro aminopeptidase